MNKKWKDKLLSSGFPLEYEVSDILIKSAFHVGGEYAYIRRGYMPFQEFSVDLESFCFISESEKNDNYFGRLTLLIECKYRKDGKTWLFMPDDNDPDFSPIFPAAIRQFPQFTSYKYNETVVTTFCNSFPAVMKGIEININGGDVFDTDIRHAINQLRYGLPGIISREIGNAASAHPDDCKPFFILPLIVTNAPIRILNSGENLRKIYIAENLDDISTVHTVVDVSL
ncbi:MAG TPA: hypothetical protein VG737_16830 [Cyclobacteriaceae bacterium]|nr:hypothetical protein [Cyclobacteriaceae bacterium]